MKKILFGVVAALAVAVLAGCNFGLDNDGGDLDGNKWKATYTVDGTDITAGYKRAWEQFGSANANLEKVQAITTRITVKKDGSILDNTTKPVFGFIFDLDKNSSKQYLDFCTVGFRFDKADGTGCQYYFERYTDVDAKELKTGEMTQNALGPYFTFTGGSGTTNKLFEYDLLPIDSKTSAAIKPSQYTGTSTDNKGTNDWKAVGTGFYTSSTDLYFDAYLHVTQDVPGTYVVYLSKSEKLSASDLKLGEFGIASGVTLTKDENNKDVNTTITSYTRNGPVLLGNKGAKSTNDTKDKYYLAGGIAAYASAPKGTKLAIEYNNLKESLRGELNAQVAE